MPVEKRKHTMVQSDAFPDAIADQEPAVEHRDLGLVAGEEVAVDVYLDGRVAVVGQRLVRTLCHRPTLAPTANPLARRGSSPAKPQGARPKPGPLLRSVHRYERRSVDSLGVEDQLFDYLLVAFVVEFVDVVGAN